jgi:hypothetical protein
MKLVNPKPVRYHFLTKDSKEPVVFVVVTCCTESWLREPRESTYPSKLIKGLGVSQEIQRIYGYFGMACNRKDLHAQLFEGSLDYSTQSESGKCPLRAPLSMSSYLGAGTSGMSEPLDNYVLTVKDVGTSIARCFCLSVNDQLLAVPVYDGRKTYFDVNADLGYLDEVLPRFEENIPQHSCVVIGHTTTCYKRRDDGWGVGFNIKWAVVLATPS